MADLIKVELLKLKKSVGFKVVILTNILLSVFFTMIMVFSEQLSQAQTQGAAAEGIKATGYEAFITSLTQVQSNIICWAIFAALFICADFVNRTAALFVTVGKSRISVFIGKMTAFLIGCTLITLIMPVFMTLFCTLIYGFGEELSGDLLTSMLKSTLIYLLANLSIANFCALIAYLSKNVGAAIGIGIGSLLTLLLISQFPFGETGNKIIRYTVFGQANLVPVIKKQGDMIFGIMVCLVTMAITLIVTYLFFRKTELK